MQTRSRLATGAVDPLRGFSPQRVSAAPLPRIQFINRNAVPTAQAFGASTDI
jgi:hypothetical protein